MTNLNATRPIAHRTHGQRHGQITRLISPPGLGEALKPFVFLDAFGGEPGNGRGFGWHPHSGIATLSLLLEGQGWIEETSGERHTLEAGGVEWMQAGGGVWHTGGPAGDKPDKGLQLWIALPAELEDAPAQSRYLTAADIPAAGPARVILGSYEGVSSSIAAPAEITYLDVRLTAGQRWTYEPSMGQDVAWIYVYEGLLEAPETVSTNELAVFSESEQALSFRAAEDVKFVIGSAPKHPHDLILGPSSVHTDAAALARGEREIERIRTQLSDGRRI
jgi:redox-sensitive bicupin YhaK (pirin superfamily)